MKVKDDLCVHCPAEMGCRDGCPYINRYHYECDICGSDDAEYQIEYEDYCEDCADKYLNDIFNQYTVDEKARLLNVQVERLE